jgi:rhodanese-related sulfurtransferase
MSSSPRSADQPARGRRGVLREAIWLLLPALAAAVLTGWLHPRSAFRAAANPEVPPVDVATARSWAGQVVWIDARPAAAFAAGHIPDAVNLTEATWEDQLAGVIALWRPEARLIVYCDGAGCQASTAVARRLRRELPPGPIHVLTGGWPAWRNAPPR